MSKEIGNFFILFLLGKNQVESGYGLFFEGQFRIRFFSKIITGFGFSRGSDPDPVVYRSSDPYDFSRGQDPDPVYFLKGRIRIRLKPNRIRTLVFCLKLLKSKKQMLNSYYLICKELRPFYCLLRTYFLATHLAFKYEIDQEIY